MSDTKLNETAEPQAEVTAAAAPAPERVKPRRRFLHLSILQRVTISQIIYIVLFAVAAVMIFFAARDQQAQQDALDVDGIYAVHEQAAQLSAALARAGAEIKRADVQPERLKQAAALALQARGEIEQLNALITALPATQVKTKILEPFKQYVEPNFQRYERLVIARITAGEQPEADIVLELSQNMSAALSAMEQQAVKGIYRSTNNANRLLAYLPQAMFLGLAVMAVCFLLTHLSLRRSLNVNAGVVLRALKRIEQGDLSVRIRPESADEIGRIAFLTDSFVESSDKTLSLIRSDIERLRDMVVSNRGALDAANTAIMDQRNRAQDVASATAEMEEAVEKVAEFAKSTLTEVKNAEDASETCRRTMSDNITTTHTLSDRLRASSEAINRIHEMGDKINSIVKTIEDIADQTNLLALNATIEAARAGDAGRGFAIVAEEVRNLANKTAVSTREVRSTISELDEAVINSVNVMASCEGEMDNSLAQSSKANSSIEEIMGIIATISDMSEQIVASCEQQASSAGEINQSIANISKLTEDSYEQVSGINASMSDLAALAHSQEQELEQFTLSGGQSA